MAEVTTRGGGLPRTSIQRGRGRGRGAFPSDAAPHPNSANGFAPKTNGHRSYQPRTSANSPPQNDEPEELKLIRKKHGQNLATIRELFPTWTDEDLLMALNEAGGDLELAAARISEGLTEQWGSVKTRKDKKAGPPAIQALSHPRLFGGVVNVGAGIRGGRGRSDGLRGMARGGGRGAAPRGARGGAQWANGSPRLSQGDGFAAATPSAWFQGPPTSLVHVADPDDASAADRLTDALVESASKQAAELGTHTQASTPEMKDSESTLLRDSITPPAESIPVRYTPEPAKRHVSRVIPPGSKMSWAQIARPADPPKPPPVAVVQAQAPQAPPQSIPVFEIDVSGETLEPSSEAVELISPPTNIETIPVSQITDDQVTVTIPDSSADVWHTEPVTTIDNIKNAVAGTGPNVWNEDPLLHSLGVGEGWAETVLAHPADPKASIFDSQVPNASLLAPSDAINITPLEMNTPVSEKVTDVSTSPPIPSVVIVQEQSTQTFLEPPPTQASVLQPGISSAISAPPGLSKRANSRKGQEAAVVMPGSSTPSLDRTGLKFGSLSLFGEVPVTETAPTPEAPSPPVPAVEVGVSAEPSFKTEELAAEAPVTPSPPPPEPHVQPTPPSAPPAVEEKPTPQPVQGVAHTLPVQSHAPTAQPQSSAFASRYPATNQYATAEPTPAVHPSTSLSHPPQQHQQQQQQQAQQQQQDAFLHYPNFRQDPMTTYFQQHVQQQQPSAVAQHSNSPAPTSQSPANYGAFNHISQQQQQQQQQQHQIHQQQQLLPPQSQQSNQPGFSQTPQTPDYAALYGQDSLRSLGYYDSYTHAQAAQAAFQSRSPHGGEDASKSAVSNQTPAPQGQPQIVAQHQQQPAVAAVSAANQQYPSMQPSPMPYPYYPYYQQYGQMPPSYQSPAYPYGMQAPSPYYSVQGSQQYPVSAARNGQSQYPIPAGPGSTAASTANPLPSSHHQQPQHGSQHALGGGIGLVSSAGGFRQVTQPGVGGSQMPGSGQGVVGALVSGAGQQQQQAPSSMQQHGYYGSNYVGYSNEPQQQQVASAVNHHHHHHAQPNNRQHHPPQVSGQASGGQGSGGERKDPFTFSSDRFFGQ